MSSIKALFSEVYCTVCVLWLIDSFSYFLLTFTADHKHTHTENTRESLLPAKQHTANNNMAKSQTRNSETQHQAAATISSSLRPVLFPPESIYRSLMIPTEYSMTVMKKNRCELIQGGA